MRIIFFHPFHSFGFNNLRPQPAVAKPENGTENLSYCVLEAAVRNEPRNVYKTAIEMKMFVVIKHSLFYFLFGMFHISWFGNKLRNTNIPCLCWPQRQPRGRVEFH